MPISEPGGESQFLVMEKCPICKNFGDAFPESKLTVGLKVIHYQQCNACGFTTINMNELEEVLQELESKVSDLESEKEDLESENARLKKRLSAVAATEESSNESEAPSSELSFHRPR